MGAVPLRHGLTGPCDAALRAIDGADALALAEMRRGCPPAMLATALLARVVLRIGTVAPVTLAALRALTAADRERLLLALYAATFGGLDLVVRCPDCAALAELDVAASDLIEPGVPGPRAVPIEAGGLALTICLPTGGDMEAAAGDPERSAAILLGRVLSLPDGGPPVDPPVQAKVETMLRDLDPLLAGEIDFACPACGSAVPARLDALELILARLPSREALDGGTLVLARAYGWREADIQAIPLDRRARYVAQAA